MTIHKDVQLWLGYPEMIRNKGLLVAANNIDRDVYIDGTMKIILTARRNKYDNFKGTY